jgi:hypothetical protein
VLHVQIDQDGATDHLTSFRPFVACRASRC